MNEIVMKQVIFGENLATFPDTMEPADKVEFIGPTGERVECFLTYLDTLLRDFPNNKIMRIKYFRGVRVNGQLMSLRLAKDIIEWYDMMVEQGRIN